MIIINTKVKKILMKNIKCSMENKLEKIHYKEY